ncbi:antibiotic acetyltransferase, partial [Methylobacterium sp. WL18]
YAVVAGNPARVVRRRFDEATVAALVETAWWDQPHATVTRLVPLLQSGQIADLLAALRAEPDSRTGEPFALPDARGAAHETDPRSGR